MKNSNQEQFVNWVEQVEKAGKTVTYSYYKDNKLIDRGTMYPYEFSFSEYDPDQIFEVTSEQFICQRDNVKEQFSASDGYIDEFGQKITYENPPHSVLVYEDSTGSNTVWGDFTDWLSDGDLDYLLENWDGLMNWANSHYPNSISLIEEDCSNEDIDEDSDCWWWYCYSYNPKYSFKEIV